MSKAKNLAKMAQSVTSTGTLTSTAIQGGVGSGGSSPKITSITYPGNDTATDIAGGGVIVLTGANFVSGAQVVINGAQASVVTVNSSTQITFTAPANSAGSYILYVVNPDGGTTILVPGIQYSGVPAWTTAAGSIGTYAKSAPVSLIVAATGDGSITYSIVNGSLPTGLSLNSNTGAITGTSPEVASTTTYTFTVRATDAQNQDTDRIFTLAIQPALYNYPTQTTFSATRGQFGPNSSGPSTAPSNTEIIDYLTNTSQTDTVTLINNGAGTYIAIPASDGYIYFTVPISGTWRIYAQGGGGGGAGSKPQTKGAGVGADFVLNAGDVLWLTVGIAGATGNGATTDLEGAGGGGASVVAIASSNSKTFTAGNMTCLLMAAGGYGQPEQRHTTTMTASVAQQGTGGAGFTTWTGKSIIGGNAAFGGMTVWGGWGGGNSTDDSWGPAGGYGALYTQTVDSYISPDRSVSGTLIRDNNGTLTGGSNNGVIRLTKI